MNERTLESLNEAEDIMSELDPFYGEVPVNLEAPVGFIAQKQCIQFKAVLEALENAVMNLYTQDEPTWEQIGKHLITLKNLQQACLNIPAEYEQIHRFYKIQLKPIVQQIIEFCEKNHTEIPRTVKVDDSNKKKASE